MARAGGSVARPRAPSAALSPCAILANVGPPVRDLPNQAGADSLSAYPARALGGSMPESVPRYPVPVSEPIPPPRKPGTTWRRRLLLAAIVVGTVASIAFAAWLNPLAPAFPPTMWVQVDQSRGGYFGTRPALVTTMGGFWLVGYVERPEDVVKLHRPLSWLRRRLFPYVPSQVRNYRRTTRSVENEHGMWWAYEPVNGPR